MSYSVGIEIMNDNFHISIDDGKVGKFSCESDNFRKFIQKIESRQKATLITNDFSKIMFESNLLYFDTFTIPYNDSIRDAFMKLKSYCIQKSSREIFEKLGHGYS